MHCNAEFTQAAPMPVTLHAQHLYCTYARPPLWPINYYTIIPVTLIRSLQMRQGKTLPTRTIFSSQ